MKELYSEQAASAQQSEGAPSSAVDAAYPVSEHLASMPDSLEKDVMILLHDLYSFESAGSGFLPESIKEQAEKVASAYEGFFNGSTGFSSALREASRSSNVSHLISTARNMLKKLRPFNFCECIHLIEKSMLAAQKTKGSDILLLLGRTGAGKSTFCHYIGGSTLEETTEEGMPHIQPTRIINPDLQDVVSSARQVAITHHVSAVRVLKNQIEKKSSSGEIVVCDTPGLDLCGRPEMDIADGVGVRTAVSHARSVRPLVVLSSNFADRADTVELLADWVVRMIKNPNDLEKFQFLYTKSKTFSTLKATLTSLMTETKSKSPEKEGAIFLLQKMIDLIPVGPVTQGSGGSANSDDSDDEEHEQRFHLYNPLMPKQRRALGTKLLNVKSIKNPSERFLFSSSERSQSALREQIAMDERLIRTALKENRTDVVAYRLSLLQRFVGLVNDPLISDSYNHLVALVVKEVRSLFLSATECIDNIARDNRVAEDINLDEILNTIQLLEKFESVRAEHHLSDSLPSAQSLYLAIDNLFVRLSDEVIPFTVDPAVLANRFEKLRLISAHGFSEKHVFQYRTYCDQVQALMIEQLKGAEIEWNNNSFSKCGSVLTGFKNRLQALKGYLGADRLDGEYELLRTRLLGGVSEKLEEVKKLLSSNVFQPNWIDRLAELANFFQGVSEAYPLFGHLDQEKLQGAMKDLLAQVGEFFNLQHQRVSSLQTLDEGNLSQLQRQFEILSGVQKIQALELVAVAGYERVIQSACDALHNCRKETEETVRHFINDDKAVNHKKLSAGFALLSKARWLDNYRDGVVAGTIESLLSEIARYVESQVVDFKSAPIRLQGIENIKNAAQFYRKLTLVGTLSSTASDFDKVRDEFRHWIVEQVTTSLSAISSKYNSQSRKLGKLLKLEAGYSGVIAARLESDKKKLLAFIQEKGFADIDSLRRNIDSLSSDCQSIDTKSKKLSDRKESLQMRLSQLEAFNEEFKNISSSLMNRVMNTATFSNFLERVKPFGCKPEELDSAIVGTAKEIQNIDAECSALSAQLTTARGRLKQLQEFSADYDLKATDLDGESVEFERSLLIEHGFSDLNTLRANIQTLEERSSRTAGQSCNPISPGDLMGDNFFDSEDAQSALAFLETMLSFESLLGISPQITEVHTSFTRYIKQHIADLEKEVSSNFSKITGIALEKGLDRAGVELVSRCANFCSHAFSEIRELHSNYAQLFNFYPRRQIIDRFVDQLKSYYGELMISVGSFASTKNMRGLQAAASVARALAVFDPVMSTGNKYFDLYTGCSSRFYTEATLAPAVFKAITDGNYEEVATQLSNFSQTDNAATKNASDQIKVALSRSLTNLIDEAESSIIMWPHRVNPDLHSGAQALKEKLNRLKAAATLVGPYLPDLDARINLCVEEVKARANEKLEHYLQSIQSALNSGNFHNSENDILAVNKARIVLASYCTESVKNRLDQIVGSTEEILTNLVKDYENLPISQYNTRTSPKDVFDQIKKASNVDTTGRYTRAEERLQKVVSNKCKQLLEEARKLATPTNRNNHMRELARAVRFLPENMKQQLEDGIKEAESEIETSIQDAHQEVQDLLQGGGSVSRYQQYFEAHKKDSDGAIESSKKVLKDQLSKEVSDLTDRILASISEGRMESKDLVILKEIADYEFYLRDYIPFPRIQNVRERLVLFVAKIQKMTSREFDVTGDEFAVRYEAMKACFFTLSVFIHFYDFVLKSYATGNGLGQPFFSADFLALQNEINQRIVSYFESLKSRFDLELEASNAENMDNLLACLKSWDWVLPSLKAYVSACQRLDGFVAEPLVELVKSSLHRRLADALSSQAIEEATRIAKISLRTPETTGDGKKKIRDAFYKKLKNSLVSLQSYERFLPHFSPASHTSFLESSKAASERVVSELNHLIESVKTEMQRKVLSLSEYQAVGDSLAHVVSCVQNLSGLIGISLVSVVEVESFVMDHVRQFSDSMLAEIERPTTDPQPVSESLLAIKRVGFSIPHVKEKLLVMVNDLCKRLIQKPYGSRVIAKVGVLLSADLDGIGSLVLDEHACFKGYLTAVFNEKTKRQNIDYVLTHLRGDGVNKDLLRLRYTGFRTCYDRLVEQYLAPEVNFMPLLASMKKLIKGVKATTLKDKQLRWERAVRDIIPELLAHLFAVWTLKHVDHYFDAEGQNSYLLQPHAAQVVSLFRLLGLDADSLAASSAGSGAGGGSKAGILGGFWSRAESGPDLLVNNLVQLGTGEGKSVILAMLSCVFALLGCKVNCASYSSYLSDRDYRSFSDVFETLGIRDRIYYGTFHQLCESVINKQARGSVRDCVSSLIAGSPYPKAIGDSKVPEILLIDEVDVFFSKDFYANSYRPAVTLKDSTIAALANYVWAHRADINSDSVKASAEYRACCDRYGKWSPLIQEATKEMLKDLREYQYHSYEVKEDKIGYLDQDEIVFNRRYGYKTLFAYYHEHEKGKISKASLDEHIDMHFSCGDFSYAEIAKTFNGIVGVTGTLEVLNELQERIMKQDYGISRASYVPSVYGTGDPKIAARFVFNKEAAKDETSDVQIIPSLSHFEKVKNEIESRMVGRDGKKRAVLVFFESVSKLNEFKNSPVFADLRDSVKVLSEETDATERELLVQQATMSGQITLLTRIFGRGTDFVCRDQTVLQSGGVHVIQTFLSEEISEQVQIQGRAARQGEPGSYSLILDKHSLERFLITDEELSRIDVADRYALLDSKRNEFFANQYAEDIRFVGEIKSAHQKSMQFLGHLTTVRPGSYSEEILPFLVVNNLCPFISGATSRTICLMDGTGSMAHLMQKAKNTVTTMFERAGVVLKDKSVSPDCFEMKFLIFRNYDCQEPRLIQDSGWQSKPEKLRDFMATVNASGGTWPEEAVEIGLWHVNAECKLGQVDQVILIGDAPANSPAQVRQGRAMHHTEAYWSGTKYKDPTTVDQELAQLKIPVHAFYVTRHASTVSFFNAVAAKTGGNSAFLDVNSAAGADLLTDSVTQAVLRNVGDKIGGRGEEFVNYYKSKDFKGPSHT